MPQLDTELKRDFFIENLLFPSRQKALLSDDVFSGEAYGQPWEIHRADRRDFGHP